MINDCSICLENGEGGCWGISEDYTLNILNWYYDYTTYDQDQEMFAYFGREAFG